MKGRILILFLILTLCFQTLVSCTDEKEFTYCEMVFTLDDGFEEESDEDFNFILNNGEIVVSVVRVSLDACLEIGISPTYTPRGFAAFFMNKSGKSDELLMRGDIPYYTYVEETNGREVFYTVTFYRSLHAYFAVAYATEADNREEFAERFLEYADLVYFNDAPDIKTE